MRSLLIATILLLLLIADARAARISEISFSPRVVNSPSVVTLPAYIEISQADPARVYQLAVIDAAPSSSPGQYGFVWRLFTLSAGRNVRLVADGAWPFSLPSNTLTLAGVTLNTATSSRRTLLLFDGTTTLSPLVSIYAQSGAFLPGQIMDVVTWGPSSVAYGTEPVYDFTAANAAMRPALTNNTLDSLFLSGTADADNLLDSSPPALLNPGLINLPALVPEPGAGLLLALGVPAILRRRGQALP